MHRANINRGCNSPQSRRAPPSRSFLSISSPGRRKIARRRSNIRRIIRYALFLRKHTLALGASVKFVLWERSASGVGVVHNFCQMKKELFQDKNLRPRRVHYRAPSSSPVASTRTFLVLSRRMCASYDTRASVSHDTNLRGGDLAAVATITRYSMRCIMPLTSIPTEYGAQLNDCASFIYCRRHRRGRKKRVLINFDLR